MILKKPETFSNQILLHFEKKIYDGSLQEGDRIPSTTALANQFGVNPETVQTGLKRLMERGLIERTRGKGTFVRKGYDSRSVGLVFGQEIFTDPDTVFYSLFLKELRDLFEREGWNYQYFVTTRDGGYDRTFHTLEESVQKGDLQAIVEFCTNGFVHSWIESSPIPSPGKSVMIDYYDFTTQGLRYLIDLGFRNITLIHKIDEDSSDPINRAIADVYAESGLNQGAIEAIYCDSKQKDGYLVTKKLMQEGRRPDAMLFGFDCIFRGGLYALLEMGIKIPDDIAVLTHSNKGIEIFSHIPLTKLEFDAADFAREDFERVKCRLTGKKRTINTIKPVLIRGKSCGE